MTKNISQKLTLLFYFFLLIYSTPAISQIKNEKISQSPDSLVKSMETKIFLKNPSSWLQGSINQLNSLTLPLKSRIDTFAIQKRLEAISASAAIIRENMLQNSSSLRLRYIVEFYDELKTDIDALTAMQNNIQKQSNILNNQSLIVTQITDEADLFMRHSTAEIKSIYQNEINSLKAKLKTTDSFLNGRLMLLVRMDESINSVASQLEDNSIFAQNLIKEKENSLTHPNYPPIWNTTPADYKLSLKKSFVETSKKSLESMTFFVAHGKAGQVLSRLLLLVLCILPLFLIYLRNRSEFINAKTVLFLQRYPIRSSIILGLVSVPFFVNHAPFLLLELVFISLTIIVSSLYLKKYPFLSNQSFFIILAYYILLKLFNLLVIPTFAGRIVTGFSILLIIPMFQIFSLLKTNFQDKTKMITIFFSVLLTQIVLGWFLALIGYFMLGRAYFISAFDTVVLALALYVSVYTLIDYLRILIGIINKRLKAFYLNREIADMYLGNFIKGLAIYYFIISVLKYINVYDFLASSIINWINEPRIFGGNVFSYNSIFLFVAYSAGAVILADFFNKLIDTNDNKKHYKRRTSLGSFMLLLRFSIISIGFILAFIASGIPVNQLTVLMGAVGVGIGFGLQNIFNNMVSGLIIAIEKPISVGDMIDVGTNSGWVKEIGIRASNIQSFDGAEIIVPNGEIISNRITNWTHSDKKRRIEILIGVAYKSDPRQVYELFMKILEEHPEILKTPDPFIVFTGMGDSSLDFRICFWIADFIDGVRIKSEVLFNIFDILKENQIEIPFPQHDLHLRSVDVDVFKQAATPKEK
jgi:potassium efflux system protein